MVGENKVVAESFVTKQEKKKTRKLEGQIILFKALQSQFHPWELIVNSLLQVSVLRGTKKGYPALLHWRGRYIFSKPKHPDLKLDATCLQKKIPTSHQFLWRKDSFGPVSQCGGGNTSV